MITPGHTSMSDIPESYTVDTKIMNQLIFYRKLYQGNHCLGKTATILDFYVVHQHFKKIKRLMIIIVA